jgi:hypothetical protein
MTEKTTAYDTAAAAFEQLSGGASEDTAPDSTPTEESNTQDLPGMGASAEPTTEEAPNTETASEKAQRLRDEGGRFAKGTKDAQAKPGVVAPTAPGAKPVAPKAPVVSEVRPPNGLSAVEKEAFKGWPKEAQAYAVRREREQAVALQKSAEGARNWEQVSQVIGPYAQGIAAMGGNVLGTVGNLLRTQHVLQYGTAQQKAQTLAGIINQFGDLDAINAVLASGPQSQAPQQAAPQFGPADVQRMMQEQFAAERQRFHSEKADEKISTFSDAHPYFEDVRGLMGTLMESAHAQGLKMDMERAYNIACQTTPEVAAALAAKTRASANVAPPSRLRAAAGSLRPRPSLPTNGTDGERPRNARETAALAWDALSGQR